MENTINVVNEIKKDLYKSKEFAKFGYYDGDTNKLYYYINLFGDPHIFPISVITKSDEGYLPSDDLKGAKFDANIKGSELIRWIIKAQNSGDLIKLK